MNNAILPSQLYSFGSMSHEFMISEVPATQMDNTTLNLYGSSFSYIHSNLYDNQYDFFIPPQFPMDYQSGLSSIMSTMTSRVVDSPYDIGAAVHCHEASTGTYADDSLQSSFPFTKKLSVPRDNIQAAAIRNPRKRPIEVGHDHSKEGSVVVRNSNVNLVANEWKTNKKVIHDQEQKPSQDKKQEAVDQIPRAKLHVRRSQKLSDKITALQKLVSPYGKTDTASVLEEASISIKLLQDQIKSLLNKLSCSCINTEHLQFQKADHEEMQLNLHNRGLCLVPLSLTQRLVIILDSFNQQAMSRNMHATPRNF